MGDRLQVPLEFSIEIKPTGERHIVVKLKNRISYPLMPVIRALKEEIRALERSGRLR